MCRCVDCENALLYMMYLVEENNAYCVRRTFSATHLLKVVAAQVYNMLVMSSM